MSVSELNDRVDVIFWTLVFVLFVIVQVSASNQRRIKALEQELKMLRRDGT